MTGIYRLLVLYYHLQKSQVRSVKILSLLSAILLGLIQGVTEFLPISSSGHLAIAENLLHMSGSSEVPGFFDVLLHLGTLVAVFIAYWSDIREMVIELFYGVRDLAQRSTPTPAPPARRLILLIIVGTLPLFAVLPIKDAVESLSGNMYFVAGALLVTGCLLFASDRVRPGRKTEKSATLLDVLLVGVAQAIATCPGISRSGTTITAGCFVGFERRFAVRYSFLMSIPAILGANILSLKDAVTDIIWADVPVYLVGVAVAAAVGYVCIRLLKMIADKGKFGFFAYYCWAVGIVTLILTLVQK
ncbi:MAG: undecaprenyl-diphosphate phosphatase [Oscillibacter sp.]|nr:undecaprenyl-diphosphate phosphatase [Oscillibacter sp.]